MRLTLIVHKNQVSTIDVKLMGNLLPGERAIATTVSLLICNAAIYGKYFYLSHTISFKLALNLCLPYIGLSSYLRVSKDNANNKTDRSQIGERQNEIHCSFVPSV